MEQKSFRRTAIAVFYSLVSAEVILLSLELISQLSMRNLLEGGGKIQGSWNYFALDVLTIVTLALVSIRLEHTIKNKPLPKFVIRIGRKAEQKARPAPLREIYSLFAGLGIILQTLAVFSGIGSLSIVGGCIAIGGGICLLAVAYARYKRRKTMMSREKKAAKEADWVKGRGAYSKVSPALVVYGLWYPGLAISLLLMLALCGFACADFFKSFNYSDLESVILWILGAFWYGLCLVNAYRIRKGKKPALWKEGRKALGTLNTSSAFIIPSIIFIGMVIAIFTGAPWDQALIGIVPSGIWIAWGVYAVLGMKKNEISIEDFVKEGREAKEGEAKEKKSSRVFKFVTPSFALRYCYYPGLLGGFAVYLVLAGFRGGFDVFSSPTGPNVKGFLWTLLGILLYVWAITNLFKIRGGKNPLFHYSPRRAFHAINTRSAVDMPLALIGILWSMGAKAWTVACIALILLFMAWGIFVEVGCYRNGLVPDGFVKEGK